MTAMYSYSEYKTESPGPWPDAYEGVAASTAGVSPDTLHPHFNNRTPDSTDSYTYPNQYYPSQYLPDQQTPTYYGQQQQANYYNADVAYYPPNGYHSDQRLSPEYYQQSQYEYNSYQNINGSPWHQGSAAGEYVTQPTSQQPSFMKSEPASYNSMMKPEVYEQQQQQQQQQQQTQANTDGCMADNTGNNFYYETYSAESPPGRLPPMPHFGFAHDSNYKMMSTNPKYGFPSDAKKSKTDSGQNGRITDHMKEKKKSRAATKRMLNRFNGMSEEEVAKRGLPDYLREGLDIVFIGINPSMFAAYTGKYYDGPGNHFWQALHMSGLLSQPMCAEDDHKLLDLGIGFTNIVARTTRGLSDLTRAEIAEGAHILREKLIKYKPKIAVFNGKAIYEVYSGQKKFMFGRQPDPIMSPSDSSEKTWLWVMPSSSARCAQLPRAVDKVPFFDALRKFRDHLNGKLPQLDVCEIVFANVTLRNQPRKLKTEENNADLSPQNFEQGHDGRSESVDYSMLEPTTDERPARVPPSVDAAIEAVIRKYSASPSSDQNLDETDDGCYDDLDEDDSNSISIKEEDLT